MNVSIKRDQGMLKVDIDGRLCLPLRALRAYLLIRQNEGALR